jgi:5,10-methenyltetrahydrofolate synthetase
MHEEMGEFRRPDPGLKLQDFREALRAEQLRAHASRGIWRPWAAFDFEEHLKEKMPATMISPVIGYFATRTDWDEPESLPDAPDGTRVAYPRIKNQHLSFHICPSTQLVFNRSYGVWEAPSHAEECTPDFLFIPCFAADLFGRRLGRGGGYYDRYLQAHPGIPHIGILHSSYVFDMLPKDWFHSGDQRIESVLTETSFYFDLKEYTI